MRRDGEMERIDELLADEAVEGLDPAGRAELDALLRDRPHVAADAAAMVAARVAAATAVGGEALPAALRARIAADAGRFFAAAAVAAPPAAKVTPLARRSLWMPAAVTGWLAAAAAWLLMFAAGPARESQFVATTASIERSRLLAEAPDVVRIDWKATEDPAGAGASGDVVWSKARQQGYMRFRGLARNDPQASQYQLWIFDAARDQRYPIDGGVFDVTADGEVVVPIRARLPVAEATLFAVTVERPGGVVVSDRTRLPLLAPVAG